MSTLKKIRNRPALTSRARRCRTSCESCRGRACTPAICQDIRLRMGVFACLNSWPKISSGRCRSEPRSRLRIEFRGLTATRVHWVPAIPLAKGKGSRREVAHPDVQRLQEPSHHLSFSKGEMTTVVASNTRKEQTKPPFESVVSGLAENSWPLHSDDPAGIV